MLQINSETAHKMFIQLMERFDKIEKMLERQNKMKECLDGDTLLDNYDLSKLLGVLTVPLHATAKRNLSATI